MLGPWLVTVRSSCSLLIRIQVNAYNASDGSRNEEADIALPDGGWEGAGGGGGYFMFVDQDSNTALSFFASPNITGARTTVSGVANANPDTATGARGVVADTITVSQGQSIAISVGEGATSDADGLVEITPVY